ncbi:hypothetical protein U1Q18_003089 [Sarracenia purpurea var. burkii]
MFVLVRLWLLPPGFLLSPFIWNNSFYLVVVFSYCAGFPAACLSVGAVAAALHLSSLGQLRFHLSAFKGDSNCLLGFSLQAACWCHSQFAAGFRGMLRLFGLAWVLVGWFRSVSSEVWPCFVDFLGCFCSCVWSLVVAPACFSSWSCCSSLVLLCSLLRFVLAASACFWLLSSIFWFRWLV